MERGLLVPLRVRKWPEEEGEATAALKQELVSLGEKRIDSKAKSTEDPRPFGGQGQVF
jgi:hypothetical protein